MVQQPAGGRPEDKKAGLLKGVMASLCHHCPLCRYGRKSPQSLVGRILHHPFHAEHCPFWKAERQVYREASVKGGPE
jgi:hypothetical protein